MQNEWHIISSYDPQDDRWDQLPEPIQGDPSRTVRAVLGGNWSLTRGDLAEDMAAAYWNARNGRKAFVLRMPRGMTRASVLRVMEARAA